METTDRQPTAIVTGIRASDNDRERTAATLHAAASAGMLTLSEVDERSELLYASRFRHELELLVQDLPADAMPERSGTAVDDSMKGHVRAVWAALVGLLFACGVLARKHPRITFAGVLALAIVLGVSLAFGGPDMHEHMHGVATH